MELRALRGKCFGILLGVASGAVFCALLMFAYTPIQDQASFGGTNLTIHAQWPNATITWELNPNAGSNVATAGGTTVQTAVTNAWNAWTSTGLNGQIVTGVIVTNGGNTTQTDPNETDCQNIVSFTPSTNVIFPTGAIAFSDIASQVVSPGQTSQCGATNSSAAPVSYLINADVVFNPRLDFSTTTPPTAYDVQSISTHEFGHALGLDHSGMAHVMMYPFGDSGVGQQRNLAVDDVAGLAFIYPSANFATLTGTIAGKITLGGTGLFAAHVLVVDGTTGASIMDGLTNPDGTYKLVGVPPGNFQVVALPLAKDDNSGLFSLGDFAGWTCGYGENSAPCCDPSVPTCTGKLQNPTDYSGKFF